MCMCVQMKSSLIQTWEVHYLPQHCAVIAERKTFDKLLLFLIHRTCAPSAVFLFPLSLSSSPCWGRRTYWRLSARALPQNRLNARIFFTQSISCQLSRLLHGRADVIQHNAACLPSCSSLDYSRSSSNWVSCHSEYQSSSVVFRSLLKAGSDVLRRA